MDANIKTHSAVANARGTYVRTPRDGRLERVFDLVRTRAANPNAVECRCLVLVGETGAGKSRALERQFNRLPGYGSDNCELISISMPSPATLKVWGRTLLPRVGYDLQSDLRENVTWELARNQLATSRARILHFDEFQHVVQTADDRQKVKIRNTLKSLLLGVAGVVRPVGVVLSGLPEIVPFIEADPQVRRRCFFVKFKTLTPAFDGDVVEATIVRLAADAGCAIDEDTLSDLAKRVLHAATGQLGQAIDLVREAIDVAEMQNDAVLSRAAFAEAFEIASGSTEQFNPFIAEDWSAIDANRVLLDEEGPYPATQPPIARALRRTKRSGRAA